MEYQIRNIELADAGRLKIEWVQAHMPVLNVLRSEFERDLPFKGIRIAMSIHLEAKTAYLALVLRAGGAELAVTGCNPLSTQDDVAAGLVSAGVPVFAWHDPTPEEYEAHLTAVLLTRPHLVIDDGGDLIHLLHTKLTDVASGVIGGAEETTTGVMRLRALEKENRLLFPMYAVNDARCKFLFDNRYGTGESAWSGILRTTNLLVAGKTVVVVGYGWCGRGIAMRADGLGANVIICEVDPVRAIEAHMDGYRVLNSLDAAAEGDMFVTASGCKDVLREEHFSRMKNGAVLANAGHFNVEINQGDLEVISTRRYQARHNIEGYVLPDGRVLYLLAEGRLVNLAAGDGHPAEIMDLSFALQALAARHILAEVGTLEKRVYNLPPEIDRRVAGLKLASLGITIDELTAEQTRYLQGWE